MPVSRAARKHLRLGHRWALSAALLLAVLGMSAGLRGDGTFSPRAQRIGNQLICTCGCTQGALTCTTLNCSVKLQMQAEIRQRAQSPEPDSLILQSFVQEYGTEVLANPTTTGFNLLAWVMPWVALGAGLVLVLYFLKRWRREESPVSGPAGTADAISRSVEAELEAELTGGQPPKEPR